MRRITVTIPDDVLQEVELAVSRGEADSVSAYIAQAVRAHSQRESASRSESAEERESALDLLREWNELYGPPGPEAEAWVKAELQRVGILPPDGEDDA